MSHFHRLLFNHERNLYVLKTLMDFEFVFKLENKALFSRSKYCITVKPLNFGGCCYFVTLLKEPEFAQAGLDKNNVDTTNRLR